MYLACLEWPDEMNVTNKYSAMNGSVTIEATLYSNETNMEYGIWSDILVIA